MFLLTALLYVLLAIKHFLYDFTLQTHEEMEYKGVFGDMRGAKHSVKHGLATLVIFYLFIPLAAPTFFIIDAVTHYLIDFSKVKLSKDLTPADKKFWVLLGLDQLAHTLVYVSMIALYLYLRGRGVNSLWRIWH
jgi:Protein of unknown function (DUF3307)